FLRFIVKSVYNKFLHPLAKFHGPAHRAFWSIPYIWEFWNGKSVQNIHQLHQSYGSVVRIAPDALSFTSAQAWKGNSLSLLPKTDSQVSINIIASNDVDHARMRKLTAHAFTDTALREQLPLIAGHVRTFIKNLDERASADSEGKVDFNKWVNALTFDIIADLSFGEALGALDSDGKHEYIDDFYTSCKMWPLIPTAWEYTIANLGLKLLMKIPAIREKQEQGYLSTKGRVQKRMAAAETPERKDFMTYILKETDEKGMTEAEIVGSTAVFVNAGGESTAACIAGAMYYLLRNPQMMQRAQEEVHSSFKNMTEILQRFVDLPYLNAVIEETLRIYPPTPGLFQRRTGSNPEIIDGYAIPPNTAVGVHVFSANHSQSNFANPNAFIPERWLPEGEPLYHTDAKAAMQPWSIGPRGCLGKRLAYIEIRAALAALLWEFDIEPCTESANWVPEQTYNIVWNRSPLYIKLRRRGD
ncbi:putative benzoate 4-monooxygenase cytochrome P450, partial [Lojkania enalia]